MEIKRGEWIEIERKRNVKTEVYIPLNYPGTIALDATINQPERLNPEDEKCNATLPIGYEEGMESSFTFDICDSPNPENK